jgi:hypothetical protein
MTAPVPADELYTVTLNAVAILDQVCHDYNETAESSQMARYHMACIAIFVLVFSLQFVLLNLGGLESKCGHLFQSDVCPR